MEHINNYADERLIDGCLYCGAEANTREHVPSKILLMKPFPSNLPVMPACFDCNNSFSLDEEYFTCVLGCIIDETTDPELIKNSRVSKILKRKPALRNQIESSKKSDRGKVTFSLDNKRFENIIRKLAVGHAAFEFSLLFREEPLKLTWRFLSSFTEEEKEQFCDFQVVDSIVEIGSRNQQRLKVLEAVLQSPSGEAIKTGIVINEWVEVQPDIYKYHASFLNEKIIVKIVMFDFFACEVIFDYL